MFQDDCFKTKMMFDIPRKRGKQQKKPKKQKLNSRLKPNTFDKIFGKIEVYEKTNKIHTY